MSADYFIYTELKLNGKWISIDGTVPTYEYNYKSHRYEDKYEYRINETYYNGSRSFFWKTYEKLKEIGYCCKFSDLSRELKHIYSKSIEDEKHGHNPWWCPICIDFKTFEEYVKQDKYDSHGLLHKDRIFEWENDELEEMYPIDHDDYIELSDEERKQYIYYEWDDPYGWNGHFKEIEKKATSVIDAFKSANYMNDDNEIRLVLIGC